MSEPGKGTSPDYGAEIQIAREAKGWSQSQLAAKTGYRQPYVSKVENGQQLGSEHFAQMCDEVFGTPGIYARMRERAATGGHPAWFVPYVELERTAVTILD